MTWGIRSFALAGLALVATTTTAVAKSVRETAHPAATIDTLYVNATIWTGDKIMPSASSMVVRNGSIVTVSRARHPAIAARRTVDLHGAFVMPGFIDSHVHLFDGGTGLGSVDLRDAKTKAEFVKRIGDYAATLRPGRWILVGNWDHMLWGGELPRRQWVDSVTGDHPLFVNRSDGHMALANSAALKLAGIDAKTVAPKGGEIDRDPDGQPTGIVKDNALELLIRAVPRPSDDERVGQFLLAQKLALSLGLTEVHAVTLSPTETWMVDTLRMIHRRGLMKLRVYGFLPLPSWRMAKRMVDRDGRGDEVLRWGAVKLLSDGALGSSTAWFYQPYSNNPANRGFPLFDPAEVKRDIIAADRAGLHVAVHAIGDRAIDTLIADYRAAAGPAIASRRFRIEHFQHPSAAAIKALAASRIIASMQPYHAIDDGRWAESRIGPERIKTTYAFRSILDAGGLLSFGSDWPVAPLSPLEGVYAAVTRRTIDGRNPEGWQPQQKISVDEALTAYTATNAYAGFEEGRAGTLTPGKRADFVILSADPRRVDPVAIRDIKVVETVIGGESVYRSSPDSGFTVPAPAAPPSRSTADR